MNLKMTFIFYIIVCVVNLFAQIIDNEQINIVSKVLLMPCLAMFYYTLVGRAGVYLPVIIALFFSWGGDTLLLFAKENPIFFLLGLASFFLAHVFYIYTFVKKGKEIVWNVPNILLLIGSFANLICLLYLLLPVLPSDMKIPVLAYGLVITLLFCSTLYLQTILAQSWKYLLLGVALFMFSDSLIAFSRFRFDLVANLPNISFLIMLTYMTAQGLIIYCCRWIDKV